MSFLQYEQFEALANSNPDSVAVETVDGVFTYGQLLGDVTYLSQQFEILGLKPQSFVGLNLAASYEYIVGLLASNKLNAIFTPLGDAYPAKRIETIVKKTQMRLLLTLDQEGCLIEGFDGVSSTVKRFELPSNHAVQVHGLSINNQDLILEKDLQDVAYLLSTSGSTGEPKLILGIEKGLDHFMQWQIQRFNIKPDCRCSLLSPVTFDVSLRDILVPLQVGGAVIIPDASTRRDPYQLIKWLSNKEITLVHMVPTLFRGLIEELDSDRSYNLSALKHIVLPGEPLYPNDVDRWEQLAGRDAQLVISYGPSETSIAKLYHFVDYDKDYREGIIPLGEPLPDVKIHIFNESGHVCEPGEVGEVCVQFNLLSKGYLNLPEKEAQVFVQSEQGDALYMTGDLAYQAEDNSYYFKGRKDHQIKLRGQRIELLEIESVIKNVFEASNLVAVVKTDKRGEEKLVVYLADEPLTDLTIDYLREGMQGYLPDYMLPSALVHLDKLPTNINGKIDRAELPELSRSRPELTQSYIPPINESQKKLSSIWMAILDLDRVGIRDNFFDLGGTSQQVLLMLSELREQLGHELTVGQVFEKTNIEQLVEFINETDKPPHRRQRRQQQGNNDIAIVGMALNVPGADSLQQFWDNLVDGEESITHFNSYTLHESVSENIAEQHNYVAARGILHNAWEFDADFFGLSRRETEVLDPQQRQLIQLSQHALEDAAVRPYHSELLTGVFAGIGNNDYYNKVLVGSEAELLLGEQAVRLANEKDYVALRIAHLLNLKGMAISVHTACSTSLVAICQGVDALRNGRIDTALCGGAYMPFPQESGHLHTEGGFASKDGHCKPFDADASGTLFSSGAGMVVLKRYEDAISDQDHIYAVIKGVGVNNDGGGKMSFMSPSSEGQAAAIQMAIDDAGIKAESIDYIETHGTATPLGDPIEVEALAKVYKKHNTDYQLGSVKSNIGHLDAAAGVIGLIKTALSIAKKEWVPTLHYKTPNPVIPFKRFGMQVNTQHSSWVCKGDLPRAAVSAFGIGGTNAHVVLEGVSQHSSPASPKIPYLLTLSAKTEAQLQQQTEQLKENFEGDSRLLMSDVSRTLIEGRKMHEWRRFIVCNNAQDAIEKLSNLPISLTDTIESHAAQNPKLAFLFPGQGSQYVGMGSALYEQETVYRANMDLVAEKIKQVCGEDIRHVILPANTAEEKFAKERIHQTQYSQLALFAVGYALAQLWQSWRIKADIMVGHSIGEYVSACLAGVFSLDDAVWLVHERGRLMQSMPAGDMLSVSLDETLVSDYLNDELSIAAVNSDNLVVVAGSSEAVSLLQQQLEEEGIPSKKLVTSHAFHSHMMEPILADFAKVFERVTLNPPKIPMISTVTASYLSADEAMSIDYWVGQVRKPVMFAKAVAKLFSENAAICIELGPRASATTLARRQIRRPDNHAAFQTMAGSDGVDDLEQHKFVLGQLWARGKKIDRSALYGDTASKVSLPVYPFSNQEYRLDKAVSNNGLGEDVELLSTLDEVVNDVANLLFQLTDYDGAEIKHISFLEAGIDSLGLTQFSLALQKKYKVPVSLTQMLNEYTTSSSLGEYIYLAIADSELLDVNVHETYKAEDLNIMLTEQVADNVRLGIDKNGDPAWFRVEPRPNGKFEKLKGK